VKKVGLVSFAHESNSFNPNPTTRQMFKEAGLCFGKDIIHDWSESQHEIGGMIEQLDISGAEIVPLVSAWAMSAGPVEQEVYEEILTEILTRIAGESLDGLLLSLHGAMVAQHIRDADGATVERIRGVVGPGLPIVMTLDHHANVSPRMISGVTATTIYRTNPHIDQRERGREAARILQEIMEGRIHPVQALEKPPVLITILAQKTQAEPLASLYRELESLLKRPGIISASIASGFPYADVEEMGPAFLVVADGDEELARMEARALALSAWRRRAEWNLTGTPVSEAVNEIRQTQRAPITLLDVGDNVGGGSPADSTVILEALQKAGIHNFLVVLYDPKAVQACLSAGVGQNISLEVGGKTDNLHGRPVPISGRVRLLHDGYFEEYEVRHGGKLQNNQGLTAVVESPEGDAIVLTSLRMAPFSLEQVRSLGIKPELKRVLVAKGAVAPRAAYEPVSAHIIEVDTPGITAANSEHFTYQYRPKPMFPFEREVAYVPDAITPPAMK
jgi:microcystin degradation protein MlrC